MIMFVMSSKTLHKICVNVKNADSFSKFDINNADLLTFFLYCCIISMDFAEDNSKVDM